VHGANRWQAQGGSKGAGGSAVARAVTVPASIGVHHLGVPAGEEYDSEGLKVLYSTSTQRQCC